MEKISYLFIILLLLSIIFFSCNKASKQINMLNEEAEREAEKIISKYYLIENDSWYSCRYFNEDKKHIENYIQNKNVHTKIEAEELNKDDLLNGIEWEGHCYLFTELRRLTKPILNKSKDFFWDKWNDWSGGQSFAYIKLKKEKGVWIIEKAGEGFYDYNYYKKPNSLEIQGIK
jgi:hypothetical protein